MQKGFVIVLKMFQDKCNRDCNRDYFQCNRNRFNRNKQIVINRLIVNDYIVILFSRNCNRAGGK